jgi:predicted ATP-grasp superfamily ATP-dependent carboligase
MKPKAVVMNMFYTGMGIARSLGERDIPVIGLSAHRGIYGNFTRYAEVLSAPDSRRNPGDLLAFLLDLGRQLSQPAVIFPTRDDDLIFLAGHREDLTPYFRLMIPPRAALGVCLDKWETYASACRANVPAPRCWRITSSEDVERAIGQAVYPCVLKPLAAHHWRRGNNWEVVGGRKAIEVGSPKQLRDEYAAVAQADARGLLQELVSGDDDCLFIAACYFDRDSNFVAGFNTRKLLQAPARFGTGCIVQGIDRPELFDPTIRLLKEIGFTGIAEVEYKWDAAHGIYQLIEINPRSWDQHRLGKFAGVDLAYLAYCDHAGLPMPQVRHVPSSRKWIAEDAFIAEAARLLWRRDRRFWDLCRLLRGKRTYAIWSLRDPLPFMMYMGAFFLPSLLKSATRRLVSILRKACGRAELITEERPGV